MNPIKKHGTEHTARYLLLLGNNEATRALLFAQDHRFLAEMFDDEHGLMLGNLMRAGTACRLPEGVKLPGEAKAPTRVQCFALA